MRALLTGISGFAGGYLAEHLLSSGDAVLGVTRNSSQRDRLPPAVRNVSLVAWDLEASPTLPPAELETVRKFAPDCLYHLAALSLPELCGATAPTPECRYACGYVVADPRLEPFVLTIRSWPRGLAPRRRPHIREI